MAPVMMEDIYYQLRSPSLLLSVADDNTRFCSLKRGDYVLCMGTTYVDRKRCAVLLHQTEEGETVHLLHRVSRFGRGKGEWREVNPMLVIALADRLPTL